MCIFLQLWKLKILYIDYDINLYNTYIINYIIFFLIIYNTLYYFKGDFPHEVTKFDLLGLGIKI